MGGSVESAYEPVLDEFTRNFDERGEIGAAVCVYRDGKAVVDLWGGVADPRTNAPWQEETIVLVFSSTRVSPRSVRTS
jgi:CubicO group peptidase (beta-lactamase class C family)